MPSFGRFNGGSLRGQSGASTARAPRTFNPYFKASMGRLVGNWSTAFTAQQGTVAKIASPSNILDGDPQWVKLTHNAVTPSAAEAAIALAPYSPTSTTEFPTLAIKMFNPTKKVLSFRLRLWSVGYTHRLVYGGSIKPTKKPVVMTFSPNATVSGDWVAATDQIAYYRVEQPTVDDPEGVWQEGDELWFGPLYADVKGRATFMVTFDDPAGDLFEPYPLKAGAPASGRSAFQMMSAHGLVGTVYLVPDLLDKPGKAKVEHIKLMQAAGWSIGSHSKTHPIDGNGGGLRLLGLYGWLRSRLAGNGFADCRVTGANAATGAISFEADPKLITGSRMEFLDAVPPGAQPGFGYWVHNLGGGQIKLCTTAANANAGIGIAITANWTGVAEWRYPGSRPDHTAIYEDIVGGSDGLTAQGLRGHEKNFALPQGGWDHQVRMAIELTEIEHTRGISTTLARHRVIDLGWSTGGATSSTNKWPCGFPQQGCAASTDGSFSSAQILAYLDQIKRIGGTGANYHHASTDSSAELEVLLAQLEVDSTAGLVDVITVDEQRQRLAMLMA